jgi:hypothetical protein
MVGRDILNNILVGDKVVTCHSYVEIKSVYIYIDLTATFLECSAWYHLGLKDMVRAGGLLVQPLRCQ